MDSDLKEINFLLENVSQTSDLVWNQSILTEKTQSKLRKDSELYNTIKVFFSVRELRKKRYKILNRAKMDPITEQYYKGICSINDSVTPFPSQAYQKFIQAYQKITSLYSIIDENLFIFNTENDNEEMKDLKIYKDREISINQLPNGELFLICNWNSYPAAFIIDRNYRFRELPAGLPKSCRNPIYYDRSVYCFGENDDNLGEIKRFDLDDNRWATLAQTKNFDSFRGNCALFNGNILKPKNKMSILMYSIDIGSFSKIYLEYPDYTSKSSSSSGDSPLYCDSSWSDDYCSDCWKYNYENDYEYKTLINTEKRLYLIKCVGGIYESEIENCYVWARIADKINFYSHLGERYWSYNKEKIFFACGVRNLRKYFYFDLKIKNFVKYKTCYGDPNLEPDIKLFNYAKYLIDIGKGSGARKYFIKAIELNPENENYHLELGKFLLLFYRTSEAIKYFNRALRLNPEFKKYAETKIENLESDKEIECYNMLNKFYPGYLDAYKHKANRLEWLHRYLELIECCNQWIKYKPNYNKTAFNMKGKALNCLGRNVEELEFYSELIKLYPKESDYYLGKGRALRDLGRFFEIIEFYNEAIKIFGGFDFKPKKREILEELGKNLKDIEIYNKVIKLDPKDALYCYSAAIELDPKYSFAYSLKGKALHHLGKSLEALECYDELIKLEPKDWIAHLHRGVALHNLERYLEAIESYSESIKLKPNNVKAYVKKAASLIQLERYLEAIEYLNWALKLEPNNRKAYILKQEALCILGRNFEAIECLQ